VFWNGRRVERAQLAAGDELRLGDVVLSALDDSAGATRLASAPEAHPAALPADAAATQPPPDERARPLTLTVLATGWLIVLPLALAGAVTFALIRPLPGPSAWLVPLSFVLVALAALALGFGILGRCAWLPAAQIAVCVPAAASCLLAPVAVVVALYFLHPRTRAHFGPRTGPIPAARKPPNEAAFTTAIVAALVIALAVVLTFFSGERSLWRLPRYAAPWGRAGAAVERMRTLYGAEESFRRVCNVGYADLDALERPASVIPGFPPSGRPFIPPALAGAAADGYRFELSVSEPMVPTADCPTFRRYRSFRYTAEPVDGVGRFYLLQSDGRIHWSENRPARADDPLLEAR
jgi:hypothetical protein